MKSFQLIAVMVLIGTAAAARAQSPQLVAETEPLTAEEQLQKFHLPPGFRIELIAAEPDCRKPMNLKFDAAGKLWFTQSIEYPWPVEEGKAGRDTIRVMTDTNDDGVPDATHIYAEGLNIPIGITPVYDGVLGYSIPQLLHFTDADGDGVADDRKEFYGRFGFRDTHGMCSSLNWWVDGWVYGCHGFSNESKIMGADGKPIVMQSGNTYRLRPDGSHIEYVSHGQVNPFGMCFDALGNQYTSDCHTKPAYLILRGAYYPSFGKPHDGLGFGPELLQHLHGSTGIAGIVHYSAAHFPPEYRENLFIGNPVTGRINRDTLEQRGSTYQAIEQPDFLTCDDPWFRPVDLQLAPDGSLYIADFYNRIIGHYEVPLTHPGRDRERGRIWRISYVGEQNDQQAPRIPDLTRSTAAELIEILGHAHLPVRVQATHQLVHRIGNECLPAVTNSLQTSDSAWQRTHALWVLERLGALNDELLQQVAEDTERLVRVHLTKVLAERGDWTDGERRIVHEKLLGDADPFVRRAAVDAIGRHPTDGTELQLIQVWNQTPAEDTLLTHTAKMAVRDSLLQRNSFQQIEAAAWTSLERRRLMESLLGARTPESAVLAMRLFAPEPWPDDLAALLTQHVVRYVANANDESYEPLISEFRSRPQLLQEQILRAARRGFQERGEPGLPAWNAWANDLATQLLSSPEPAAVIRGAEFCRDLTLTAQATRLHDLLRQPSGGQPDVRRLIVLTEALAAVNHPELLPTTAGFLRDPALPLELKQQVAQVLGSRNLPEIQQTLVQSVEASPSAVALAIARGLAQTAAGGELLLASIQAGKSSPRLLQDAALHQRLQVARLPDYDQRREQLLQGLPPENEELAKLLAARKESYLSAETDLARGRLAFEKTCMACHKIGERGAKVGPELDGVGLRGLDRLLEDTLDPSRNVDAAFRSTVLVLNDGRVLTGLVAREEGAVLVLLNDQGKEVTVPLDDIEERQQTRLSPMPANVTEKLSPQEYADLLRFLLDQRVAPLQSR